MGVPRPAQFNKTFRCFPNCQNNSFPYSKKVRRSIFLYFAQHPHVEVMHRLSNEFARRYIVIHLDSLMS